MKQKYTILRNRETNELVIKEYAELDKDILSLVCEQRFDGETVQSGIEKGKDFLISVLRTRNMYPPGLYVAEIAKAVTQIFKSAEKDSADLHFDELAFLSRGKDDQEVLEEVEEESNNIDELLEEDIETTIDDANTINNLNSSIKIADDDALEIDEDL